MTQLSKQIKNRSVVQKKQKQQNIKKKKMENTDSGLKIPNQLCQEMFNCQFQLDIGNVSQQLISKTIELYSEAISYFISQKTQGPPINKRVQFYQDKIRKLLTRKDVEKCLIGKKVNPRCIDLQQEIDKIKEWAPQQAKALIQFYKAQSKNQERLIQKSMDEQNSKLHQRIARRSKSKSTCGESPVKPLANNSSLLNGGPHRQVFCQLGISKMC